MSNNETSDSPKFNYSPSNGIAECRFITVEEVLAWEAT
jgi:hypothetical protein